MKWFKHQATANMDAKLQEIMFDYGLEGYGLYWYCLELIAGKVEPTNLTFELEHDARIIARNTGSSAQKVQEMMSKFVELGLFENSMGTITCLKMAQLSDDYTAKLVRTEQIKNEKKMLKNQGLRETPTNSEKVPLEENRIEQNRIEKNNTYASSDAGVSECDEVKTNKTSKQEYCSEFEWIWTNKYQRDGDNKKAAYKACVARIKSGVSWKELAQGMSRYKKYCQITNTEPRYRKLLATFFGPDEHFKLEWNATSIQANTVNKPQVLSSAVNAPEKPAELTEDEREKVLLARQQIKGIRL